MSRYVIAVVATGEIVSPLVCDPSQVAGQAPEGYMLAESEDATSDTHWMTVDETVEYVNEISGRTQKTTLGTLVAYTDEQRAIKANRPHPTAVWSNQTMSWTDTRSVDDMKTEKTREINEARLAANQTTFPYLGKEIACDTLSRGDIDGVSNYIALNGTFPPDFPMAWKCLDNTYVPIPDVDTFKAFYGAMVAQGTANFAHSEALKAQLKLATTPEEVDAIKW